VHFLNFGQPPGLELKGIHPAVIISPDSHNFSRLASLVRVVPLTTLSEPAYGDELVVEPPHNGLPVPILVHVLQARAVDRKCILCRLGRFSKEAMRQIEEMLREMDGIDVDHSAGIVSEATAELAVAS
jgi:mRNA-degrading endonuclease toxin of MazEF toxin-antitoxin module